MSNKLQLTNFNINQLAVLLNEHILSLNLSQPGKFGLNVYAVPRGGIPAAYALKAVNQDYYHIVDDPKQADIAIDDIIDSGETAKRMMSEHLLPTYALIDKTGVSELLYSLGDINKWIVFPWEMSTEQTEGVEANVIRILQYIGEDAGREGLLETPRRFSKALGQWFSGYGKDPKDILKVFEDGAESYDQMVIVKDIPIYSKCEHHIADIFGTATIAYIPNGKIVGLSKLSRLADIFSRRLQVQERLTQQIADALEEHLAPKGVGVLIKARHMCMESRGLCQQGHHTITCALHGVLKNDVAARAEFMALAK